MNPNDLTKRWSAGDLARLSAILLNGGTINSKTEATLSLSDRRLDLRGIQLPAKGAYTPGVTIGASFSPSLPLQNKVASTCFNSVDLAFVNLSGRWIQDSKFTNVLFLRSNLERISVHSTHFIKCVFDQTNFDGAGIAYSGTRYEHCVFKKVKFSTTAFACAEFDDCTFEECKFNNADFCGCSFERCTFIGKVHDVWFRGHYPSVPDKPEIYNDFVRKFGSARPNKMKDVDFSNAALSDITFSDECDLSTCKLPHDEFVVGFSRWPKVLQAVEARIPFMFNPDDGKVLELVKVDVAQGESQQWYIVNFRDFSKFLSLNVIERLKELFIEEAKKIGALAT